MSNQDIKISISSPSLISNSSTYVVTSGQIISGVVTFLNPSSCPSSTVNISLSGNSNTKIEVRDSVFLGDITLFTKLQTLHTGALSAAKYEWPFKLTFPSRLDGELEKKWAVAPPWGRQFPLSMEFRSVQTLGYEIGEGLVKYKLEALIQTDSGKSGFLSSGKSKKATVLDLYYLPCRTVADPDPKVYLMGRRTFRCRSALLVPSQPKQPSTFCAKAKSLFKKSNIPIWQFMMAVNVPEVVYVGGPLLIFLSFLHKPEESTAKIAPSITLMSCKLTLIRTVLLRAKGLWLESQHSFDTSSLLSEHKDLNLPMSFEKRNNLSELLALPPVQTDLGVSFSSLNVTQYYKLRLNLTLGCVDKTFEAEFDSRAFLVLSPVVQDMIAGEGVQGSGDGL